MDTPSVLAMLQEVAAEVITPRFRALAEHQVMEKNPGDLVTVADHEAEVLITRRLADAYPHALIVGEEAVAAGTVSLDQAAHAEHWFTVDPVDGTKNFVHGSADHAVMAAEMRGRDVVRAWIWQPELGHAYVAERSAGAWRDDTKLAVAQRDSENPVGRSSKRSRVGTCVGDLPPMQLSWACCGVDYPRLIEGQADYLWYGGAMPWDHAPGSLLLGEAGGALGYLDGAAYDPTSVRVPLIGAATPTIFQRVVNAANAA